MNERGHNTREMQAAGNRPDTGAAPSVITRVERQFLERLCGAGGQQASQALAAILGVGGHLVEWSDARLVETAVLSAAMGSETGRTIGVQFKLGGHLPGHLSFLLSEPAACALVERLLGPRTAFNGAGEFTSEAASALAEAANIVTSAFLTPVADSLKRSCVPSPPRLIHHRWTHVLRELFGHGDCGLVLGVVIGAQVQPAQQPSAARILFAPNAILLEELIQAARLGAG